MLPLIAALTLLADVDPVPVPDAGTVRDTGIVTALVLALAGPFFMWLNKRTDKQYDAKLLTLEAETRRCAADHAKAAVMLDESKRDRDQMREKYDAGMEECRDDRKSLQARIDAMHRTIEDYHAAVLRSAREELERKARPPAS